MPWMETIGLGETLTDHLGRKWNLPTGFLLIQLHAQPDLCKAESSQSQTQGSMQDTRQRSKADIDITMRSDKPSQNELQPDFIKVKKGQTDALFWSSSGKKLERWKGELTGAGASRVSPFADERIGSGFRTVQSWWRCILKRQLLW